MKLLLGLLLTLFAATAAALLLLSDAGYVLIGVGHWTVEMSLATLAVLAVVAFFALHYLLRLLGGTARLPQRLRGWRGRRRTLKAQRGLTEGLLAFAEGDWAQAEKRLLQRAADSPTPLLHYVSAARAAQAQGADDRRDQYLRLAHQSVPDAGLALGLTQAELQLEHGQLELAESTLEQLANRAPHHRQVLRLQMRLLLELGAWPRLLQLLPELRRRRALPASEYAVLELRVHGELLDAAAADGDPAALDAAWKRVPKDLRSEELLVLTYARHLVRLERAAEAEPLLREALNRRLGDRLVHLYGLVEGAQPARQLEVAEGWLAGEPRNPELLLAVGRLALRNKLWGKARSALEGSLAVRPAVETYRELGRLLERLGEHEAAAGQYREATRLAAEAADRAALGQVGGGSVALPAQPREAERIHPGAEPV